ncbi:MAG: DUF1836 domain-containing protein [Clostridia bacterium]
MQHKPQAAFAARLAEYAPLPWEQIPDLGLYMDQVLTFIERQCRTLYAPGERVFTPAMVNNYVKQGLVSRPDGKKYGREQLAQLLMICVLKQATSGEGMKRLLTPGAGEAVQALYSHFCATQTAVFHTLAEELPLPSAMTCAVRNAAYHLLCNELLTMPEQTPEEADA